MKEGGKSKKALSSFPIRPSILFVYDKIFIFSKYRIRLDERLKKVIITTIEKQRERQEVQQLATKKRKRKKKGFGLAATRDKISQLTETHKQILLLKSFRDN